MACETNPRSNGSRCAASPQRRQAARPVAARRNSPAPPCPDRCPPGAPLRNRADLRNGHVATANDDGFSRLHAFQVRGETRFGFCHVNLDHELRLGAPCGSAHPHGRVRVCFANSKGLCSNIQHGYELNCRSRPSPRRIATMRRRRFCATGVQPPTRAANERIRSVALRRRRCPAVRYGPCWRRTTLSTQMDCAAVLKRAWNGRGNASQNARIRVFASCRDSATK